MTVDVPPAPPGSEDEKNDTKGRRSVEELLWELLVGAPRTKADPAPEKSS